MRTQTPIVPTNARSPERLAPPPPLELDLVDAGRTVGWITADTLGFRGFADEHEAANAAWVAYRTLARRLARRGASRSVPVGIEPLTIRRSDDREEIRAGGASIATLVRPGGESRSGGDSFGFELRVPTPATELELRAKAHLIYRTLRKSGIRWALWRAGGLRAASSAAAASEHASPAPSSEAIATPNAQPVSSETIERAPGRERVGSGALARWVRRFIPRRSTRTRRAKVRAGILRGALSREGAS